VWDMVTTLALAKIIQLFWLKPIQFSNLPLAKAKGNWHSHIRVILKTKWYQTIFYKLKPSFNDFL
jgi:hypothetical protein